MAKLWPIALLVTACASPKAPPARPVVANAAPSPYAITETAMGPITGKTRGTLEGLRATLRGLEVRPVYDGGLEYHVFEGGQPLYYVIPADDGTVFNVHVTSGKFAVAKRSWRAGEPFRGAADLTACECWGDQPVCYKQGEHIAVSFKRACLGLSDGDEHARAVLDGVTVQRMIWSPTAFGAAAATGGEEAADDPPPPPPEDD